MAGKYQVYPEYKDSGVEWLGKVPSNWLICKTKHGVSFQVGWTPPTGEDKNFIGENLWANISDLGEKIILDTSKRISDDAAAKASMEITPAGSLLYSFKLTVGAVSFAGRDMYTNEAIASFLKTDRVDLNYLYYSIPIFIIQNASTNIYGARILNQDLIKNSSLLLPSFDEQNKIAYFLDHETAKIDQLIEKQQQLIALLKEKRQAVISHAVTKGLDPDVKMKDSGVEWLGEVPDHWIKTKLKYIAHSIIDTEHKTAPFYENGEYLVCRTTNVRNGELRLEGGKYTDLDAYIEWTVRGIPKPGDILFTREAPAGEACIVPDEPVLCLGQRMVLFKLNKKRVDSHFVLYSLYAGLSDEFIKQLSQGSTVVHFNMADIGNIPLYEPSLQEQKRVIIVLKGKLRKYDALLASAMRSIELMKERRTALISAAVTGKIDVRNWQANKPSAA